MAISTEKLLKLSQFQTGLTASKNYTDAKVKTVSDLVGSLIVAGADASYDTLKEIADWISSHGTEATAMNSAIVTLQGIVKGIGGKGEKATVVAYVTDAIAALKIGDYAKAADLTALAARVTALESGKANKATTLAGYDIKVLYCPI